MEINTKDLFKIFGIKEEEIGHSEKECNCPNCVRRRKNQATSSKDFMGKLRKDLDAQLTLSPFKVGDILTPTVGEDNSRYTIVGIPCIVVRNYEEPKMIPVADGGPLVVNNMIVATFIDGRAVIYEAHSCALRKWTKEDQRKFDQSFK